MAKTTSGRRSPKRRWSSVVAAAALAFLLVFLSSTLVLYGRIVHELQSARGRRSSDERPAPAADADAPPAAAAAAAASMPSARKITSDNADPAAAKRDADAPPPRPPSLRAAKHGTGADGAKPVSAVDAGLGDPLISGTTNFTGSRYAGGGAGGRFPARGTEEFARECGWTMVPPLERRDCVLLVRPVPGGNEGISMWVSMVVNGYILARQSGCRLMIDYGEGIDVRRVMEPLTSNAVGTGAEEGLYDWSVPAGFECNEKDRCFQNKFNRQESFETWLPSNVSIVDGPAYRFALQYNHAPKRGDTCKNCIYSDSYANLQRNLPGFRIETGFACAFANVFRPAYPTAAEFEPRLFTDILPALHDPEALVVAIYWRTGQTDYTAGHEEKLKNGENVTGPAREADFTTGAEKMIRSCIAPIERQYLAGKADAPSSRELYSRGTVWIILTDSPNIKEWAVKKYTREGRTVLVTGARGVHTRTRRNPSTADFAEGLIDWYLMGDSDLVVQNGLTFGTTASFRTARPIYHSTEKCSRKVMVFDR